MPTTSDATRPARVPLRLLAKWWIASTVVAFLVYWLLAIFVEVAEAPAGDWAGLLFVGLLVGPLYVAVPILALALIYAVPFALWPYLVRRASWFDRTRTGLFLACVLLALPAALVLASFRSANRGFAEQFALVMLTIVIGMVVPRLRFPSIGPGTFG
jgi:hypothetical protein